MQIHRFQPGMIEMIIAMALSGTIGLFVLESGQSAFNAVFFRCLFGALGLAAFCWWRGLLRPASFNRRNVILALVGGVALVSNWILLFSSFSLASISISTAAYHTQPFFLVLLSALFLREKIGGSKLGWLAIAFGGLVLILELDSASFTGDMAMIQGLGLALGAAVLYAIATLVIKRQQGMAPHLIALIQVILGCFMLAPLVDFQAAPQDGRAWGFLVGLGLIHTCIMYILLYSAFQKLKTAAIAILAFVYPAVAILVDYLVYDQDLSLYQMAGIALILIAAAGVNMGWKLLPSSRKETNKTAEA
ncbi:DMT family transporter [Aestuariispira insulae]|uniref:Threonine/homoserine efflux transporter RhtA n=1 Tax=Aestuariispira insulae TaxID=1461337 RepID=A0A3D9HRK0_9PROT|nr:DMT family transporter [Aestuariispira insulae]RED52025.1 threonine/homoserine efflux transporter RhtA [Aestuariispira insulae]